jgi:hypothetical protein
MEAEAVSCTSIANQVVYLSNLRIKNGRDYAISCTKSAENPNGPTYQVSSRWYEKAVGLRCVQHDHDVLSIVIV